jgi:ketosteroid isomerase-like protein
MTKEDLIALVEKYFRGVDEQDFSKISETLNNDCVFSVETHGVRLQGQSEIAAMFERLWENHAAVEHKDFSYIADPNSARIAAQFTVVNTELDGGTTLKSNCNFFDAQNGKFKAIAVYMAGQNTLDIRSRG